MPVTKSAKKKLRKDIKREKQNLKLEQSLEKLIKDTKKNPSLKKVQEASSAIDKAAKKNIIHKNKASRLKSSLTKLLIKGQKRSETKTTKRSPRKQKKAKK